MHQDEKNRQDQNLGEPQLEESDKGIGCQAWSSNFPDPFDQASVGPPGPSLIHKGPGSKPTGSTTTIAGHRKKYYVHASMVQKPSSITLQWPEECDKKLKSHQLCGHL